MTTTRPFAPISGREYLYGYRATTPAGTVVEYVRAYPGRWQVWTYDATSGRHIFDDVVVGETSYHAAMSYAHKVYRALVKSGQ